MAGTLDKVTAFVVRPAAAGYELLLFEHYAGGIQVPAGTVEHARRATLARAASPSPAEIDADIVTACREGSLSAPAIVELVSWLSVLQILPRLSRYFLVE